MAFISSTLKYIATFIILGVSAYTFYNTYNSYNNPCLLPITYTLSAFDERFGVTESEFLSAVNQAVSAWETKTGIDLFQYDAVSGDIGLHLIYDERQLATKELDTLDSEIDDVQGSYESLKARYDTQIAQYEQVSVTYESQKAVYDTRREAYQKEVSYWNNKGGASESKYKDLEKEKEALSAQQNTLDAERQELNNLADSTNRLADRLNTLAKSLNKNISQYNAVGEAVSTEFDQGLYERDQNGERITVYQFDTTEALIHVLTHEFGHALDLEHSENQESIMYYLHQDNQQTVTDEDAAAITTLCKVQ